MGESTQPVETVEDLRKQLLRLKIQRELSVQKKSNILDHPLANIVVSFMLTGVLGVGIVHILDSRQKARDLALSEERSKQAAIQVNFQTFSELIYGRYTRATLLYSALKRRAADKEIVERKQQYDSAYYEWNAKLMTSSFLLRQTEGVDAYSGFEADVQYKLTPLFKTLDGCLTGAYDDRVLRHADPEPGLDECLSIDKPDRNVMHVTLDCSYAITDRIYRFMNGFRPADDWNVDAHCLTKAAP